MEFTEKELAEKLKKAAKSHHNYEVLLGHPDEDWPEWYASFICEDKELEMKSPFSHE